MLSTIWRKCLHFFSIKFRIKESKFRFGAQSKSINEMITTESTDEWDSRSLLSIACTHRYQFATFFLSRSRFTCCFAHSRLQAFDTICNRFTVFWLPLHYFDILSIWPFYLVIIFGLLFISIFLCDFCSQIVYSMTQILFITATHLCVCVCCTGNGQG